MNTITINSRCPLQSECGSNSCEYKHHERDCGYYQGNARPGAEIEDQKRAMEAEWEARMSTPSVLADTAVPQEAEPVIANVNISPLVLLPVDRLHQHPDNPRKELGDLTELADSIKANGILQNLTVIPGHFVSKEEFVKMAKAEGVTKAVASEMYDPNDREGNFYPGSDYTVIIGHRRLAAAKLAGLTEVPCVVTFMTDKEQVQTMLSENMQRSDLTIYEQAQGFQMMIDLGSTINEISEKAGFSKNTVRSRLKLLELDAEKFKKSEARGGTLKDYEELNKIEDPELKNKVLDAIGTANFHIILKNAVDDERFKKRLAQLEKDISAFATKIEKQGYVGGTEVPMDYYRNYHRWNQSSEAEHPADADTVRYYYTVSDTDIYLYKDRQEKIETEEDRQRKERKQKSERIEAELKAITKRHFSLRREYISNFGAAKKNAMSIMKFASGAIIGNGGYVRDEINAELLAELLGLDIDDETVYSEIKTMLEPHLEEKPEYTLLACAYAYYDEDDNGYWDRKWRDGVYHYIHEPNEELDRLYDLLVSLGYEMSDEEKALRDGTHELFHRDDPASQEEQEAK